MKMELDFIEQKPFESIQQVGLDFQTELEALLKKYGAKSLIINWQREII